MSIEDKEQTNYLSMSDDELANMVEPTEEPVEEVTETIEETVDEVPGAPAEEAAADSDEATGQVEEVLEKEEEEEVTDAPEENEDEKEKSSVDYEAVYKRIMAPFKANGRDIEVKTVDDAISLMQMGANYNKKMAALKPNLKVLKLLERNDLLDESKLSFLIDVSNKNPQAINKLISESGLDPMDIDPEKASEYQTQVQSVDDKEIALDEVLGELQDSPTYERTLGIVTQEWDGASKNVISEHPQLLKVINDHVERGIYDLINAEVERERMLGRLNGLSYLDAYRQIGDVMQANGSFNHLVSPVQRSPKQVITVQPKSKDDDGKLKEKKRAANPTQAGTPTVVKEEFNPLSMSDAEFAKYAEQKFL